MVLTYHSTDFLSISLAMQFNKRLTRLSLSSMNVTRQFAAALGAGLISSNSQHFKELHMREVELVDGAITELASGLKENSSLCTLCMDQCHLGDVELAELVDAVESHPSLKELSLWGNQGQEHALVALGKVLASRSCQLEILDFSDQGNFYNDENYSAGETYSPLVGRLGTLAQGWNEKLTSLDLSVNGLLNEDIDPLGQIFATCKLEMLDLRVNRITHSGFVNLTQFLPKSLKWFRISDNDFSQEDAAGHTLALFKQHPQSMWEDDFNWNHVKSPINEKIQHFQAFNRCGRILLAPDGGIPLSVWPIVLARANKFNVVSQIPDTIFHLLQGPALVQRRFDMEDFNQATCAVGGPAGQLRHLRKDLLRRWRCRERPKTTGLT
jgi:Ran GTPase-activating protein (RanGAP) involved in mRNA processing and transport